MPLENWALGANGSRTLYGRLAPGIYPLHSAAIEMFTTGGLGQSGSTEAALHSIQSGN